VIESVEFKNALPRPLEFQPREAVDRRGRFQSPGEPLGIMEAGGLSGRLRELYLSSHPTAWFRLMPQTDPGRTWSVEELEDAMKSATLLPLSRGWRGYDFFRTHEGYGVYSVPGDQRDQIRAIVSAFTTGEVWSIDTYWLEAYKDDNERFTIPNEKGSFEAP
jgi:hypothetical protein